MVALRLIRLIETHSEQIARTLATRIRTSPRTSQLQKYRSPSSQRTAGTLAAYE
jgi:hypothetical protein